MRQLKTITAFWFLTIALNVAAFGQEIKLMSYNIGSSIWSTTRDSVVARINVNEPDVLCAIEAGQNRRPYLESELTNYRLLLTFGGSPNLAESHIFLKRNMFTVLDSGYIEVSTYGGYTGPGRYVNWAQLAASSGKEFFVYASHFVSTIGGNPDSATIGQYRHADEMVQLMASHFSSAIPMITAGDFNADSSKDVMQFLQNQMPITYNSITINNPIDLEDSWYVANPGTTKPATVSTGFGRIDWILTTPNTNVTSAIIDGQGVNGNGDPPSDHLPLVITFNLGTIISIEDAESGIKAGAYPNPFEEQVQFTIESHEMEEVSLHIFDLRGRQVKSFKAFTGLVKVDLTELVDGIYLYEIISSHEIRRGRIIKE